MGLTGPWRGLNIEIGYERGEFDMNFTWASVVWLLPTGDKITADVASGGGSDMQFSWTSGKDNGKVTKCLYQLSVGDQVNIMALATGAPGGAVPTSYSTAMLADNENVYTFIQCKAGTTSCD